MGTELTREALGDLLHDAERAHHDYEQSMGKRDDDWSGCSAQYLLDRLGDRT